MYYVLRVLCLHIQNQVYKTLTAELTFQVFKRSLSDWFGSKCKCKISSYLILLHCKPNLRFNMSYLSFIVNFEQIFIFSKMGLSTVLAQLVSIMELNLWKVVIICKNNMFFKFWALFLKMCKFEVVTFLFSLHAYPINSIFQW